jgi:hypothetical protein
MLNRAEPWSRVSRARVPIVVRHVVRLDRRDQGEAHPVCELSRRSAAGHPNYHSVFG